jgi:hypothetical protein
MNITIADTRISNKPSSVLGSNTYKREWSCAKVQLVDIRKSMTNKSLELKKKATFETLSTKVLRALKIHQAKR